MAGALIVKDGLVVRGTAGRRRYETADVVVEGTHIAAIGPDRGREYDGTVVDASNAIVMPGLVNAHLHSNEGFQQGAYDNLPLEIWLGESYPPFGFPILSERDYYLRTMLAAIESIRAGVTTVQDDYVHPPATPDAMDAAIRAYADAGLRAWVTVDMWDQPLRACLPWADELIPEAIHAELAAMGGADADAQIALFERQFARWHGHDGRIRIVLAPCGPPPAPDRRAFGGARPPNPLPHAGDQAAGDPRATGLGHDGGGLHGEHGASGAAHRAGPCDLAHRRRHRAALRAWLRGGP